MADDSGANTDSGDGGGEGWAAGLPTDLQAHEGLQGYDSQEAALRGLLDRPQGLALPGDDATDDDWGAFYSAVGRPDGADGYAFDRPQMPEGLPYDEEAETWFRGLAHEAGLSQKQAERLYKADVERRLNAFGEGQKAAAEEAAKAEADLQGAMETLDKDLHDMWGRDTADNKALAERAAHTFMVTEDEADALEKAFGSDGAKNLYSMFLRIGKAMGDTALKGGGEGMPGGPLSEDTLRSMMSDPRYWRDNDQDYINKVREGWEKLYPSK